MGYARGERELDPIGQMEVQVYNNQDGLFYTVKTLPGYIRTGEWFSNTQIPWRSEQEWVREAIFEAKHLQADRVIYKAGMGRFYHSQVIWDYATERKYTR
jgi:hypothetical protein